MEIYRYLRGGYLLSIVCACITIFFCLISTAASELVYDFEEGVGDGWNQEGNVDWYKDNSVSYNGNYSLKSGNIECIGTSSLYRYVQGPAEISYWWKKGGGSAISDFTFSVDGKGQRICRSYEWEKVYYSITDPDYNKIHEIRWDFKKETCHLDCAGWIDDMKIISEIRESVPILEVPNMSINISDYNSLIRMVLELEAEASNLANRTTHLENEIEDPIMYINISDYNNFSRIVLELDTKASNLANRTKHLENKMYPQGCFASSDLDVVIIPHKDHINLTQELNKYKNKLVYLEGGVYKTGHIDLTTSNLVIRPIDGSTVTLDGLLDNSTLEFSNVASNISIKGINIINSSKYGIIVDGSSNCCILGTTISSNFKNSGICIMDSTNIYIGANTIRSNCDNSRGIDLINSTTSIIENNDIIVGGFHVVTFNSFDNYIKIDSSDRFWEWDEKNNIDICGSIIELKRPCDNGESFDEDVNVEASLNDLSCNIWEIK
jgi:parallel beta-helix repeat protein